MFPITRRPNPDLQQEQTSSFEETFEIGQKTETSFVWVRRFKNGNEIELTDRESLRQHILFETEQSWPYSWKGRAKARLPKVEVLLTSKNPKVLNAIALSLKHLGDHPFRHLVQRTQNKNPGGAKFTTLSRQFPDAEQNRLPDLLLISFGIGRGRHRSKIHSKSFAASAVSSASSLVSVLGR
jgi:hypothetical protein